MQVTGEGLRSMSASCKDREHSIVEDLNKRTIPSVKPTAR